MGKGRLSPPWLHFAAIACSSIFTIYCSQAQAAGFQLIEQSVSGMGTAYAGGAAQAQDATTIYFNPAGMTHLEGRQAMAAVHVVVPRAEFRDKGSTHLLGAGLGSSEGGDAGMTGIIPNLYYSGKVSNDIYFGLGINAPFGLGTEYGKDWIGRYHAVKSELLTININPAIAFRAGDRISIGIGINAQYIDAELTNAIDMGAIDVITFGNAFGLTPGADDGFVKLKGDDWSMGYNIGLLFDLGEQTRLGLHYRSGIRHDIKGDADFSGPLTGVGGLFADTNVKSKVTLPAMASASVFHAINARWAVMADLSWTNWSRLKELRFDFSNPLQPDGVTTLKWEDSYRYSIGATYRPDRRWTYRSGIAYDESPIPGPRYRTPRIPGEDRTWLAFGIGYKYSDQLSLDFSYAHLFMDDAKIRKTAVGEDALRGALRGNYDLSVDIISAQLNWAF